MQNLKKILIIEDELIIRLNLITLLGSTKRYEIQEAPNGRMGLEIAEQFQPDLILCDINMPELDGHGVLEDIRSNPLHKNVQFVFLTALATKNDIRAGMENGADDYLTKPFTKDELYNVVDTRIAKQEEQLIIAQEKMDELRSNLSMALPHELLTPLIGMIGTCDMLEHNANILDEEDIRECGRTIRLATKRLQRTIENFLTLSRLEIAVANPSVIEKARQQSTQSILSSVSDASESCLLTAGRVGDVVYEGESLEKCTLDAVVQIERQHCSCILNEVISNAIKFSQKGQPILIRQFIEDNKWVVVIADKGYGMTSEQIHRIGAYMQFDRPQHEQQGAGLGLAISKKISELYDIGFDIRSQPEVGTTVRLAFPICEVIALV